MDRYFIWRQLLNDYVIVYLNVIANYKTIILQTVFLKNFCQAAMLSNVVLQTSYAVRPDNKPELETSKTAA